MNNERCIFCAERNFLTVFEYDKPDQYEVAAGVSADHYYRAWVRCARCNFHYSVYSRDEHAIDRLYDQGYRDSNSPWRKGNSIEATFQKVTRLPAHQSETKKKVAWVKTHLAQLVEGKLVDLSTQPLDFLDVGGGNGIFAYEFRDERWKACIIDPSPEGRFVDQFDIRYVQGYFQAGMFQQQFGLISYNCVLEHLKDPLAILRAAKDCLMPGGLLFVEVPDALHFRLVSPEDDVFNSCHLWMFDPHSLTQLLHEAGFQVYATARMRLLKGIGLWMLAGHS